MVDLFMEKISHIFNFLKSFLVKGYYMSGIFIEVVALKRILRL